ncbi:SAM-dependent methyltransferase [Rhizosaccharibacter radicis]|uniref:SAM-dependent methyltransferase n=1 Tax=Rhizosaccharibacter radicis TaxID=2782605 RepID=A0ABT1VUI9_9PROT|nr:SAM-dependent methyltransferase [Acetobacteraceae bacterium KSS12]
MKDSIAMQPIAHVRGGRTGMEDDGWGANRVRIELDAARFTAAALTGLDGFSHAGILFLFHAVRQETVFAEERRPRGNPEWPRVGIFAQRNKDRPNRLGATICRIVAVEGTVLIVEGLDAIDGTPVLDIKPVMRGFLPRGDVRQPSWADALMENYW